ncbi:AraC family transcriptional regulator [Coraliomargarita algicola]|uniref:AraC family transcriptional regulator n=1 Tax=Coraliomargarita algicola TaxID=3092156 RepID=A0ABZ0RND5_9BACT|nr:AraC family transcriptional regulator [Coraliomargarita sp. J2-16]WPJ96651.1 AraC family transcriptional regulator [Coraliomargarita sp. J2-16]
MPLPLSQEIPIADWRNLRSQLMWAYESAPPDKTTTNSTNLEWSVWIFLSGGVQLTTQAGEFHATKNDCLILPPGVDTRQFDPNTLIRSVHFSLRWPTNKQFIKLKHPIVLSGINIDEFNEKTKDLLNIVNQVAPNAGNLMSKRSISIRKFLRIESVYATWLGALIGLLFDAPGEISILTSSDERAVAARNILDSEEFAEGFPAEKLIKVSGLSRSQLDRIFSIQFGVTPKNYFEKRKHTCACRVLRSSEASIKEIAFQFGFKSSSHFSHWFNRHSGQFPNNYRQTNLLPSHELG